MLFERKPEFDARITAMSVLRPESLVTWKGRMSRKGFVVIFFAMHGVEKLTNAIFGPLPPGYLSLLVIVFAMYLYACAIAKRLHDLGKTMTLAVNVFLAEIAMIVLGLAMGKAMFRDGLAALFSIGALICIAGVSFYALLATGQKGDNAYGPDPVRERKLEQLRREAEIEANRQVTLKEKEEKGSRNKEAAGKSEVSGKEEAAGKAEVSGKEESADRMEAPGKEKASGKGDVPGKEKPCAGDTKTASVIAAASRGEMAGAKTGAPEREPQKCVIDIMFDEKPAFDEKTTLAGALDPVSLFSWCGRKNRAQYILCGILILIMTLVMSGLFFSSLRNPDAAVVLWGILFLVSQYMGVCNMAKRLHDCGEGMKKAVVCQAAGLLFMVLLFGIPEFGRQDIGSVLKLTCFAYITILGLYCLLKEGDRGDNAYGPDVSKQMMDEKERAECGKEEAAYEMILEEEIARKMAEKCVKEKEAVVKKAADSVAREEGAVKKAADPVAKKAVAGKKETKHEEEKSSAVKKAAEGAEEKKKPTKTAVDESRQDAGQNRQTRRFCAMCGEKVNETALFCPYCGAKLLG